MTAHSVTAVIVTYNSRRVVPNALASLEESYRDGLLSECLVVDNDSADGTPELVRASFPWCTVIENGKNVGFGVGCNIGIQRASTRHVLLLNPDATLPRPALSRLCAFLDEQPRAGAAAPAIREPDGEFQPCGGLLTPRRLVLETLGRDDVKTDRRAIVPGAPPFRTSWVCGAIVMLRRAMLDQIGCFDPRYFLYFEETDLWMRAQRAGWEIWAVGEAVATHLKNQSAKATGRRLYLGCVAEHYFRSRFRYLEHHFGWTAAASAELAELAVMTARAALHAAKGREIGAYWTRLGAPVFGVR